MNIFTAPNNKTTELFYLYIYKMRRRNFIHTPGAERKELSSNENCLHEI